MDIMWSPWRSKYIESFKNRDIEEKNNCFICDAVSATLEEYTNLLIIHKYTNTIALMNRYPYNSGHILIAPLRHISDFTQLTLDELTEIQIVTQQSIIALKDMFQPDGFNIGANLGDAAGAGLPGHLHYHVIPRWKGDTSFVSTIGDMKVISQSIDDTYIKLSNIMRTI